MKKKDLKYCEIYQVNKYVITCPECSETFVVDGDDFDIDYGLYLKCPHCKEMMIIPDF